MRSRLSRRDVEVFAAAVDGRAMAGRHGPASKRLQEYVDITEIVRDTSAPTADREFVADLRAQLMSAAVDELHSAPAPQPPRRDRELVVAPRLRRRLTAAASTFVVVGGSFGLVAASAQAMPGDMLYPVKRATERVELMIRDGSGEGRALLGHATTRLEEVEALLAEGDPDVEDLVSSTLGDFVEEANAGGALLLDAYRDGGGADDIDQLRTFTSESADRLQHLATALPQSTAGDFANAARTVNDLDSVAVSTCPTCHDGLPAVSVDDELMAVAAYVDKPGESSAGPNGPRSAPDSSDQGPALSAQPELDLDLPVEPEATGPDQPADDPLGDPLDDLIGPNDSDPNDDGGNSPGGGTGGDGGNDPSDDPTDDSSSGNQDPVGDLVEPITDPVQELLEGVFGQP